jgi:hypothetical protein
MTILREFGLVAIALFIARDSAWAQSGAKERPDPVRKPDAPAAGTKSDAQPSRVEKERAAVRERYGADWKSDELVVKSSEPGGSARGVIIREKDGELDLDSNPCSGSIVNFVMPYVKRELDTIKCNGKSFQRYEVEQKARGRGGAE